MNRVKKLMLGLVVLLTVAAYPLTSKGKSESTNKIVLDSSNTVSLNGEINAESVSKTIMALRDLDSKTYFGKPEPIYLFVYSPGGSIQDGLELIDAIHGLTRPVNTITMFAASMAFQTVQNLNQRLILPNGVLMSHRAAGSFEGSFGGQNPSQIDSRYNFWLRRIQELDQITVDRSQGKQTLDSYRKQYAEETWLTGTQAVEQGYADAIVTVKCDKSLNGTDIHTISFMGVDIQYETSKCPMITAPMNVKIPNEVIAKDNKAIIEQIKGKFLESFDLVKTVK